MKKRVGWLARGAVIAAVVLGVLAMVGTASAADVYAGYSKVGRVSASYGGRFDVYEGYSRLGYVKPSYSGRWDEPDRV